MYLAWEAVSALMPDLFIGAPHLTWLLSCSHAIFLMPCRHDGIRLRVQHRRASVCSRWPTRACRCVRALPDHLDDYGFPRACSCAGRYERNGCREFEHTQPRQTSVRADPPIHFPSHSLSYTDHAIQILSRLHAPLPTLPCACLLPHGQLLLDARSRLLCPHPHRPGDLAPMHPRDVPPPACPNAGAPRGSRPPTTCGEPGDRLPVLRHARDGRAPARDA